MRQPHRQMKTRFYNLITIYRLWLYLMVIAGGLQAQDSPTPTKIKSAFLPNLIQVTGSVYSGGTPTDPQGFVELKDLGVKTVLSVDGARPDLQSADAVKLRYIHIPIGYDGITDQQKSDLLSVLKKSKPPYYIHCHHGKHRGPAAVASILTLDQSFNLENAQSFMNLAGTSPHYKGLWSSVLKTVSVKSLPKPKPLNAISKVSSIVDAMIAIENSYDRLNTLKKNNWQPNSAQPDISAAHQSLLLLEQFKELPRETDTTGEKSFTQTSFRKHLNNSIEASIQLNKSIKNKHFSDASLHLKAIKTSCIDCHSECRD